MISTSPGSQEMWAVFHHGEPTSPEVAEFYTKHPEFDTHQSLLFLTEQYPNADSWVIEGGVAIQAMTGGRDPQPHDIDVVCQDATMADSFGTWTVADGGQQRYLDVRH